MLSCTEQVWRALISIGIGFTCFAALRYFQFEPIVSAIAGAVAAIMMFLATALEPLKKALEIDKLWRERRKDAQETQEKRNLVRPATAGDLVRTVNEMKKFGSYRERKILYRAVNAQERLDAKPFIADSSDEDGEKR